MTRLVEILSLNMKKGLKAAQSVVFTFSKSFVKAWHYEKVKMQRVLNDSRFSARDQNNVINNDRK